MKNNIELRIYLFPLFVLLIGLVLIQSLLDEKRAEFREQYRRDMQSYFGGSYDLMLCSYHHYPQITGSPYNWRFRDIVKEAK